MNNSRKVSRFTVDKRKGAWIRIRHPQYSGSTEDDVYEWVSSLRALQTYNPELYSKVLTQILVSDPIKHKKDLWEFRNQLESSP